MCALPRFTDDSGQIQRFPLAYGLESSRLALGCMHMGGSWDPGSDVSADAFRKAATATETVLGLGWNFFDHADIYGRGRSELLFGKLMQEMGIERESIILQSKCGICLPDKPITGLPRWYDFSREHILTAVDGILGRLQTDYLDILLLHRPDLLMDPEEVVEAFVTLKDAGKVKHFGVSNFPPALLDLIHAAGFTPVVNQVEMSILRTSLFDYSMVSQGREPSPGHPADGTLEWHRRMGIVTQAWAPLAYGYPSGRSPEEPNERITTTSTVVREIADLHGVFPEAVVLAWLLHHPARIQPIVGSLHPDRLRACHQALSLRLSREDWYRLYHAGRGTEVP